MRYEFFEFLASQECNPNKNIFFPTILEDFSIRILPPYFLILIPQNWQNFSHFLYGRIWTFAAWIKKNLEKIIMVPPINFVQFCMKIQMTEPNEHLQFLKTFAFSTFFASIVQHIIVFNYDFVFQKKIVNFCFLNSWFISPTVPILTRNCIQQN